MAESVVISNVKENILEFDAEVKGIKDPKMSVNFVIETDAVNLSFPAKHEKETTWSVTVPPLKILDVGDNHQYMITVDVEGYHFEPMTGQVQIVGDIKPKVSKPSIKKEEKKAEPAKEEKKVEVKPEPKPEPKVEPKKEEKKVEEKPEEKVEETTEVDPMAKTIDSIITREKLRRAPADVAIRKVLDEVKKSSLPDPEPEPTGPSPEQLAEEIKRAEQLDREAKVRDILKGIKRP